MIEKQFEGIDKPDIDALVESKKAERRTLEYKAELPLGTDEAKREFLGDVASFANSAGGDLLYGIADERDEKGQPTGVPLDAYGLAVNETSEQLRLESMIREGIAPRISGIQVKTIPGFAKGSIILIRVPRSWAAPHMVTFKNLSRFYARNSAGKYQLDIGEIRSGFALSESLPEKIRAFRTERLGKIINAETPVPFAPNFAAVLHLLPIAAAVSSSVADVSKEALRLTMNIAPLSSQGWSHRFNADGFLTFDDHEWGEPKGRASTYVQVFRFGAVEVADQRMLGRMIPQFGKIIAMSAFEKYLIGAVERFVRFQHDVGVLPPIVCMLSLVGVKDFALTVGPREWTNTKIDREVLMAPDILIEDFNSPFDVLLRPAIDFIWQGAGLADSPNYDENGRWKERR